MVIGNQVDVQGPSYCPAKRRGENDFDYCDRPCIEIVPRYSILLVRTGEDSGL